MTAQNQRTDSQFPSSLVNKPELPAHLSLQEAFSSLNSATDLSPFPENQKIEIVFAQGHRLCLQGSFDWETLSIWLTPLLTEKY